MNNKIQPISEKANLEEVLDKSGSIIWKCNGVSMLPFIKGGRDLVILESFKSKPNPYDVVMYKRNTDNQYVLHRFLYKEEDKYVILGDNCVTLEYVPEDKMIAVMTGIIRDGKKVDTDTLWYKLYKQLWVKPWKLRVILIRIKNKIIYLFKEALKKNT